jgi:hypothetical protein
MNDFHKTMMGKRFIEGTVPSLVRAIEKLNSNLEPKEVVEYETKIALLYVNDGDRTQLEDIENQKFDSIDELAEVNPEISVYSLNDFMTMCNDNDSECDDVHLQDRWVGYIQLRKGAIAEYHKQQQGLK